LHLPEGVTKTLRGLSNGAGQSDQERVITLSTSNRRTALVSLSTAFVAAVGARGANAADAPPVPGAWEVFLTGKPIPIRVSSAPVQWKGNDYRLVQISQASFYKSPLGRVTALLTAGVLSFDNVEYEVHAALFDEAGKLLGTAHTLCPVTRVWAGLPGTTPEKLSLDFGISKAYERAEWFTVSITERDVLTPDQWQK